MDHARTCSVGREVPHNGEGICTKRAMHLVTSPLVTFRFCQEHFERALEQGLIEKPFISKEEFDKLEKESHGLHKQG